MRNVNLQVLSGLDYLSSTGSLIDANQLVSASFQAYFGDTTQAGTFKIQGSNDLAPFGYAALAKGFYPTTWTDLSGQSVAVSGADALITIGNCCYRWLRPIYLNTAAGVQHIVTHADVAGSLNNKYFFINGGGVPVPPGTAYYVWMNVNGAGTDPAIPGKTGVAIALATNATAGTVRGAIANALGLLNAGGNFDTTGSSGSTVIVTNQVTGDYVPASDVNTGFTISQTGGGTSTIHVLFNALSV